MGYRVSDGRIQMRAAEPHPSHPRHPRVFRYHVYPWLLVNASLTWCEKYLHSKLSMAIATLLISNPGPHNVKSLNVRIWER